MYLYHIEEHNKSPLFYFPYAHRTEHPLTPISHCFGALRGNAAFKAVRSCNGNITAEIADYGTIPENVHPPHTYSKFLQWKATLST